MLPTSPKPALDPLWVVALILSSGWVVWEMWMILEVLSGG